MPKQQLPYQPFPTESLPPEVANFVKASAAQVNCDPALVALPTLTLLASYIGNTRVLRLNPGWTEPCILWSVTIGKHGTLKSPAYDQPFRRLNRWLYKKKLEWYKAEYTRCKFSVPFGTEPIREWPYPGPDHLNAPIISEFAREVLARNFHEQAYHDRPRGILLTRDDLSDWMHSFELRRKNAVAAHKWFEMHRAGNFSFVEKPNRYQSEGHVKTYERASLSVTGTIHPETLIRARNKESGLLPHLLMAWPPPKPRQWTNIPEDTSANEAFEALFDRLLKLNFIRNEAGLVAPEEVKLSPEAEALWSNFYNRNAQEMEMLDDTLRAHFAKLEAYCARFALLLHVISNAEAAASLPPQTMQAAINLTEWFKHEHRRIYAMLSAERDQSLIEQIASLGGTVTANDLRKSFKRKFATNAEAEEALNNLVAMGAGEWIERATTSSGGRPTKEFKLTSPTIRNEVSEVLVPQLKAALSPSSQVPETPTLTPVTVNGQPPVPGVLVPLVKAVPPPSSQALQTPPVQTLSSITYMHPDYDSYLSPDSVLPKRKDTGCKL